MDTLKASAQTQINASEAAKHIGDNVIVCDLVNNIKRSDDSVSTLLILGGDPPSDQLTVVIKGFNLNSDYYKGQTVCIWGEVANSNGKYEMIVTDPEMILVHKVSVLGKENNSKHQKITNVVLTAPPNAHYFGEGYRSISLKSIDKGSIDTIKVTEKISSYRLMGKFSRIDFGGVYPNQKLTVVLKGQAKQYLDAMLEIEFKGNDASLVLNGKKFTAIGKITHFNGRPQIVINDPNLFTIIPD